MKIFDYKYLTNKHLKGFNNYKYSAIDTSPLSNYVMHPIWNASVKIIPKWIAPNLLTFVGFLCMVVNVIMLSVYDYNCTAAGAPSGVPQREALPYWMYTVCGLLLFIGYNLDGIDGKQARRIGVSGPLGEMFDHGLDSYIVFFIPFTLFSVYGRDEFSTTVFRGFLMVMSVTFNFYVSHCEKYNTGALYLPWGYDVSMWASSLMFIVTGHYGPEVYKFYVYGDINFIQVLEVVVHATGLFTTLPIAIYNVYLAYQSGKGKKKGLLEVLRPIWSLTTVTLLLTVWALKSQINILEYDPRAFMMLYGTLFSNISSRLIVSEMSEHRCEVLCWLFWPVLAGVTGAIYWPTAEVPVLYALLVLSLLSHLHYGICVVRQICGHFKISCFTVPKHKTK